MRSSDSVSYKPRQEADGHFLTAGSANKPSTSTETTNKGTSLPEPKLAPLSGQKSWFATLQLVLFHLPPPLLPGASCHHRKIYQPQRKHGASGRLRAFSSC